MKPLVLCWDAVDLTLWSFWGFDCTILGRGSGILSTRTVVQATLLVLLVHVQRLVDVQMINLLTDQHDKQMMAVIYIFDSETGFFSLQPESRKKQNSRSCYIKNIFYLWHLSSCLILMCVFLWCEGHVSITPMAKCFYLSVEIGVLVF